MEYEGVTYVNLTRKTFVFRTPSGQEIPLSPDHNRRVSLVETYAVEDSENGLILPCMTLTRRVEGLPSPEDGVIYMGLSS